MTREEAIAVLSDRDNFLWWEMSKAERECYSEVFDMAISALSENKGEDRPKGHWIEKGYVGDGNYLFECSKCHSTDTQSKAVKVNYCWHCGADMRGET